VQVGKFLRATELGEKYYRKADASMDTLERELEPGQIVQLGSGRSVPFVDKFAGRNRINVSVNARRSSLLKSPQSNRLSSPVYSSIN
jgi:hypothetical protein